MTDHERRQPDQQFDDHLDDCVDDDDLCEHGELFEMCNTCFAEMNCGLMADGQCTEAGSEECDLDCPYRDSELFVGSAAWRRKHERSRKP